MTTLTHLLPRVRRAVPALALAVGTMGALGACTDVLEVERPTLITPDNVKSDSSMVTAMVSGVEGEFRRAFVWTATSSAAATDEALFSHVWSPWNTYDNRDVTPDGGAHDGITYPFLSRARGTGEQFVKTLRESLGAGAANHAGFARALAYAGYSHVLIADHLCSVPINGSAPKPLEEVYKMAIGYFDEAAKVGAAAGATDIVHLANVGAARSYLQIGDKAKALEYARKVPAAFVAWARYAQHADFGEWTYYNLYHRVSGFRSASEFNLGLDPSMRTVRDLRVPFETDSTRRLMDGRAARFAYVPYQPSSFSGWTPGGKNLMSEDAAIRFASGLEARYIIAEAGGMNPAELRTFVNERRTAGGLTSFAGTDAQLQDELFEQRKWDFFLAGYRMADIIRYKKQYNKDYWPKGRMGGFGSDYNQNYGSVECWPIGATEKNANPNIP